MFHVKQFQQLTGSNEETLRRLQVYSELLEKWQKKINLVGGNTISDLWKRHMLDSAQLLPLLPRSESTILDFGYPLLIDFIIGRIIKTSPILWYSKIKIFFTLIFFNEYFLRNKLKNI